MTLHASARFSSTQSLHTVSKTLTTQLQIFTALLTQLISPHYKVLVEAWADHKDPLPLNQIFHANTQTTRLCHSHTLLADSLFTQTTRLLLKTPTTLSPIKTVKTDYSVQ